MDGQSIARELQSASRRLQPGTAAKLARLVVERSGSSSGTGGELSQAKAALRTWTARQFGAETARVDLTDPATDPGSKPYWDILQQQAATPAPR